MKVTKWLLRKKFIEYNKLYFDDKLDCCQFSFLNKSNVRVTFTLEGVELEEKINNKDYVLYVSKMSYQK